jgi:hypothetical protein
MTKSSTEKIKLRVQKAAKPCVGSLHIAIGARVFVMGLLISLS